MELSFPGTFVSWHW